jgi:hypothetical protein
MQLFQRGPNTLRVIVQAVGPDAQGHSSASRIESSLQGVARTSVSSSGFQILRTFTGLQPNTRYCVTATGFDSLGAATRTTCFYTAR